ncbi:unnamed protein product [Rotaria socialis]|uniref:Uncharacterized protein n=2 Tax=Rotaria socialis TaxID=392032 RepID=A0A821L538_9BILA|nr:unnamed protein product [Rotaria socialis]CAF4425980.1 unnamed protein product [Rotaria socialis]CAF4462781.1 unnamed protein product [Rotaria socialis]CAF4536216.1 unnamed protein product [Rotaria socialis]CAF4745514.1 unnamed protein product [Rotaria socialis]
MSITLRKVETDNTTTEIIDHITNSSVHRWTQRKINFQAIKSGYMSYFDFQRASAIVPLFGIDVITICQGRCSFFLLLSCTCSGLLLCDSESETTMTLAMESSTITTDKSKIISDETTTLSLYTASTTILLTTVMSTVITQNIASITANKIVDTPPTQKPSSSIPTSTKAITPKVPSNPALTNIPIEISTTAKITSTQLNPTSKSTSRTTLTTSDSFGDKEINNNPFDKTFVIVLSTAIPAVLIAIVVTGILVKKRTARSVPSDVSQPSTHKDNRKKMFIELEELSQSGVF